MHWEFLRQKVIMLFSILVPSASDWGIGFCCFPGLPSFWVQVWAPLKGQRQKNNCSTQRPVSCPSLPHCLVRYGQASKKKTNTVCLARALGGSLFWKWWLSDHLLCGLVPTPATRVTQPQQSSRFPREEDSSLHLPGESCHPVSLLAIWPTGCRASGWLYRSTEEPGLLGTSSTATAALVEHTRSGTCPLVTLSLLQWVILVGGGQWGEPVEDSYLQEILQAETAKLAVLPLGRMNKSAFLYLLSLNALGKNLLKPM